MKRGGDPFEHAKSKVESSDFQNTHPESAACSDN